MNVFLSPAHTKWKNLTTAGISTNGDTTYRHHLPLVYSCITHIDAKKKGCALSCPALLTAYSVKRGWKGKQKPANHPSPMQMDRFPEGGSGIPAGPFSYFVPCQRNEPIGEPIHP